MNIYEIVVKDVWEDSDRIERRTMMADRIEIIHGYLTGITLEGKILWMFDRVASAVKVGTQTKEK